MFSTTIKRLTLALVVPVVSLGVLTTLSKATKAEAPEQLKSLALQRVAEISGRQASQLRVINSVEAKYPLQDKTVSDFKVIDESGKIYGITLDSSGQEVSSTQLRANEKTTNATRYGKLYPALAEKLANTATTQPLRVIIWLKETSQSETSRPAPNPGNTLRASEAQVNDFFKQVDARRAAAVQPIVNSAVNKLRSLGTNISTEKYSPVVYANLTPQAIAQVANWDEVDQVYEDQKAKPTLNIARHTILADVVQNRGITGSGVQVGEVEVGGRIATTNPYLVGVTQDTTYSCLSSHSTGVAGIIRSTNPTYRGIAPNVSLWVGGSCPGSDGTAPFSQLQDRSTAAADWGARVLNLSLGGNSNRQVDSAARFYDDMVINRFRTVVVAAGNEGNSGNVLTPGVAYNIITVGSFNDRVTPNLISSFSSGLGPVSTHSDRIKPEVVAPGNSISSTTTSSPWIGNIGSGTSFATPMVAGTAALIIQRNSSLAYWPEAVKAILMTTAVHNITGDARLSTLDGAGGIFADRADDIAHGVGGNWGAQSYNCSAPTSSDVATISLTAGQRTRAAIAWDNDPSYSNYASQPGADLDLQIVNASGTVVASSASYDNTYEISDFTPSTTGTYKLRVHKYRCDYSPRWLGWAWRQGN